MKLRIKRAAALILAGMLAASFSGCGKDADTGKTDGGKLAEGFGGRTITIAGDSGIGNDESSATYAEECEFLKSLEKKYDCKIEYQKTGDWAAFHSEILNKALAGEKIADFFSATGVDIFPKWALNDLVVPLDDYIDLTAPMWNQTYNEDLLYNGLHYGVSNWNAAAGTMIFFNKKLCAASGITDTELYEAQKNKKWTWDALLSYAQKCTKLGANEDSSTYGFAWDGHYSAMSFIYSNNEVPVLRNGNTYSYNLNSAKAIKAIQFSNDLVHKYKVVPDSASTSGGTALWKKGKVAFFSTAMWSFPSYVDVLKDDQIGVLLNPMGPDAEDYINVTDTPSYIFMQPCVEDKELMGKLITDLYTPQEWQSYYNGFDPADGYLDYLFDEQSAETLRMITDRTVVECGAVSTDFRSQILWGDYGITAGTDPRTWAESNAATGQYYLDSVWSQEFTVTQDAQ